MKTNNFFSLKRFSRFLSAYLQINYKRYLFIFGGTFLILYLIMAFAIYNSSYRNTEYYEGWFYFGLVALAFFIGGSSFPEMNDKIKSSNYLLLPASGFEKVLSQFLIYVVAGILCYLLFFWIDAHLARWTLMHLERFQDQTISVFHFSDLTDQWLPKTALSFIFGLFSAACFLFAGRLLFSGRYAIVKSTIAGLVLVGVVSCLLVLCSHIFFPETPKGFNVSIPVHLVTENYANVELYFMSFAFFSWLFFLPLAYFRFKEKQV
jgi:uncharacterized integral membrane protein